MTFNKLTTLKKVGKDKSGKNLWLCQCECGGRTTVASTYIIHGHTKSCGCSKVKAMHKINKGRRVYPIVGKTYGRLTVLENSHEKLEDGSYLWLFQCECGTQVKIPASRVVRGTRVSCGCMSPPQLKGLTPYNAGTVELRAATRAWKKHYGNDGCPFDDFMKLSQLPCHYCAALPSNTCTYRGDTFIYNGLDRVDSSLDHSPHNLVSCCITCNIAKGNRSCGEFRSWIERVYECFTHEKKMRGIVSPLLPN